MSTPTDSKGDLNDDDMHALINSANTTPPQVLDQDILSAARNAVADEADAHIVQRPDSTKRWYT